MPRPQRHSFRKFKPVELPEELVDFTRASQTFLRHENNCPRSGYLYLLSNGGAPAHELERGSAIHMVGERATRLLIERGDYLDEKGRAAVEPVPPEIVKEIVNEVLAEQHVPLEEHDYIRESSYRLATDLLPRLVPKQIVACETLFVWEIGGYQVRCKIDLAQLLDQGAVCEVIDLKSSRHIPTYEEIARKRPDGTYAAKAYQLVLYACSLAFGVPVRIVEHLDGTREEIPEPFPAAGQAQEFRLEYAYPGVEGKDGTMATRGLTLTRLELVEYRDSIIAQMQRLDEAKQTGDWPAVKGDHCTECPIKSMCPIPVEFRDHAGEINTDEECAEALEKIEIEKIEHAARMKEIRNYVKTRPGQSLRFARDQVAEFVQGSETETIKDKGGMWDAIERNVKYGTPFDRSKFVKVSTPTNFKIRTLTPDELEEDAA